MLHAIEQAQRPVDAGPQARHRRVRSAGDRRAVIMETQGHRCHEPHRLSLYRFMKRMKRFHSSGFVSNTTAEMPDGPLTNLARTSACRHAPSGVRTISCPPLMNRA